MLDLAWRPDLLGTANGTGEKNSGTSWGGRTREHYLDLIKDAITDNSSMSVVLTGSHADDRVDLVAQAIKAVDASREPIHVIGTVYAQKMGFGALAFLLADVAEIEQLGLTGIMRAIARRNPHRPVVVVQYPQLLDRQSKDALAQMAFSRSALVILLMVHGEIMPPEFLPITGRAGCTEICFEPLGLDEVHRVLIKEFNAVPTPLTTGALWHRAHGNMGFLVALAREALTNGKLCLQGEHLVLLPGAWPRGGRVEALAWAQMSMLSHSERRFLQKLARHGTIRLVGLNRDRLRDVDHLISSGFVRRIGQSLEQVTHSSTFLQESLGSESHVAAVGHSISDKGNFFAFISGQGRPWCEQTPTNTPPSRNLCRLLDVLRNSLLDGELEIAEQSIASIITRYLDELPAELFEAVVIAETILDVTAGRLSIALPVLESSLAQLQVSGHDYDLWITRAMLGYASESGRVAEHARMPFDRSWETARWWFTELLSSVGTSSSIGRNMGESQLLGTGNGKILCMLAALRNGLQPSVRPRRLSPQTTTTVGRAFALIYAGWENGHESSTLAGIEKLVEAGFVVYALPESNRFLDSISAAGKTAVAGFVKRKRRGNGAHPTSGNDQFPGQESEVLQMLTNREKMVASAAAQGMNNQQIADDAGVSIRTVEGHLYQIYSKLSLGGRRELSSLVGSLGLNNRVAS
ncbi:response regulator transcription factor [Paeniglutamicibacter sp. ORCA_105]|uniref:response regulator transcription factor n=1 Tax=Paeniglutamicibacter sp. ORCA_105 TaxID=3377336 RepID=UPI0038931848